MVKEQRERCVAELSETTLSRAENADKHTVCTVLQDIRCNNVDLINGELNKSAAGLQSYSII